MMVDQETIEWLRLVMTPEVGPCRGKSLLEKFKTPQAVNQAPFCAIAEISNIGWEVAGRIVKGREKIDLGRQIKYMEKSGIKLIARDSEFYPANLRSIYDPPLALFVKGEILPQDDLGVALVGTRRASFYGRSMAEKLSRELAERGFTIVSGGARGIDTFSHQAALRAKGRTIAVLGCGLDLAYPRENKRLFAEIAEHGAVVSEFPLFTGPERGNFPMRNRIISGLSLGVVVVEAPLQSGAMITVTHANDQGREVFSVPGHADSFVSKGVNQLLREGAKLVESADDIIEEIVPLLKGKINEFKADLTRPREGVPACLETLTVEESHLYEIISHQPLILDEILEKAGLSVTSLSGLLLRLQLKGLIQELPGKQFIRSDHGG